MPRSILRTVLLRELAAMRRSVEAYPDDDAPWAERPGLPNTGGTLVLHVAGNLQHFVGAVLGASGYRRDRDAEFARRGLSRAALVAELDAAMGAVERALAAGALPDAYPARIGDRTVATESWLVHLATHIAYHLGQLDYHRRVVTGDARGVGALALDALPSFDPDPSD